MESPFKNARSSIVMYLEPLLNSYYQTYQNVITLSAQPNGPLRDMTSLIHPPRLSEFQSATPFFSNPGYGKGSGVGSGGCVCVLLRYPVGQGGFTGYSAWSKNTDMAMGADDIPSVLSYLIENGYHVDTDMTRMLQHSEINIGGSSTVRMSGKRKMICMFHYTEK